jgi:anti-sigma B factor antagonist
MIDPTMLESSDVVFVELQGEFDIADHETLAEAFSELQSAKGVLIDLSRVTYADSTFLTCLVQLKRSLTANGSRLAITGASRLVERLFSVSGLDTVFGVMEPDAVQSLDTSAVRRVTLTSAYERKSPTAARSSNA